MDKVIELRKSKRLALTFLLVACALFILTLFLPAVWWVGLIRAVAEAAMVGALADWFAVVALFKRIPIPVVSTHTNIIPQNKEKIAANLAIFVRDKFLDVDSIIALIHKHNPAQTLANWLIDPENTQKLGRHLVTLTGGILDFIEDSAVQRFIKRAIHAVIDKIDLSQSTGVILESLTRDNRHQALLNETIQQIATLLRDEDTQMFIKQGIVKWLKEEHPIKESVLPSNWLGKTGAEIAIKAASHLLDDISENPQHSVRVNFDRFTRDFIVRLQTDPDFFAKADAIKQYVKHDETFNHYVASLWGELKNWLKRDCADDNSALHKNISNAGLWLGQTLAEDERLQVSLNQHMEDAARKMAPDFSHFLTTHIRDTVTSWDDKEMSRQIELNIGKDLQYIRINGTLVGGFIGFLLYAISHAAEFTQWVQLAWR